MDRIAGGGRLRRRFAPYQETVTALLAAGADPRIRDADGRTALQNAERLDQDAIVALLR
ncbi:hypothetical protein [Nocardia salmonicida]